MTPASREFYFAERSKMSWRDVYRSKLCSHKEAGKVVKSQGVEIKIEGRIQRPFGNSRDDFG
jgi:hypothetical protein